MKTLFSIESLKNKEGSWSVMINGNSSSVIVSRKGSLYNSNGDLFTEEDICQISCFEEENCVTYNRI